MSKYEKKLPCALTVYLLYGQNLLKVYLNGNIEQKKKERPRNHLNVLLVLMKPVTSFRSTYMLLRDLDTLDHFPVLAGDNRLLPLFLPHPIQ